MIFKPRDYQQQAINAGINQLQNKTDKNGIIVLPTGAGKSIVISNIVDAMGSPTLVLQPSKEILEQNYKKLMALGRKDISIFSASLGIKRIDRITFATIGSIRNHQERFSDFGQILVDECDLVNAKGGMYQEFFEATQIPVCGLTASPWRMQPGSKLKHGGYTGSINRILTRTRPRIFEEIIHITQIHELYDRGYLTPLEYVQGDIDQGKLALNSTGADYTDATYTKISSNIRRDAVWAVRKSKQKHHLIFTKMIDDAQKIAQDLNDIDIPCEIVTGTMNKTERERIINNFTSGKIKALANVGVLTVGFDFPALDHIVLARPTNSARLYYQMLGRGIRLFDGKEKCVLTDLCGNVSRLGKIEDWILRDNDQNGLYRLYNGKEPLTGIDLKSGEDLENKSKNSKSKKGFVFSFGKFKGKTPQEADETYLQWIVDNFSPGYIKNIAQDELSRRACSNV